MNNYRYCALFLGFLALIALGSADFDQPQANQPQPPIFPSKWTALGQLVQGYPTNDTYMIFYDWDAQMQRVDQFVGGSSDIHSFLINYSSQMIYMYIERNGKYKSCVTSPYLQRMPPPNLFASASYAGHATIHGKDCNGWKLENTWNGNLHLWVTSDTNTPVRIASYGSRFDLSAFKTGSFTPGVFNVPDTCKGDSW
eukprot:TRINITY_DN381_c0_g1_i2.p1 TRINITY_DN381_c0_g1~~TRINITY_DN381_c0_g1_i2.p1  ORF type:complete len:197 (-),score=18.88 TRINITY_DN381_c0_g1_i2:132-722(-)